MGGEGGAPQEKCGFLGGRRRADRGQQGELRLDPAAPTPSKGKKQQNGLDRRHFSSPLARIAASHGPALATDAAANLRSKQPMIRDREPTAHLQRHAPPGPSAALQKGRRKKKRAAGKAKKKVSLEQNLLGHGTRLTTAIPVDSSHSKMRLRSWAFVTSDV
ncbi:hypothetical protein CIHG_05102 [Coccidioides immitis H538.4]|uniref:Uncharacterized protein n=2 Tax=Coccidioides immitis TaxID=5501 RepID=A0A0J8RRF2_COCIT|nr:hypothetical protein CIRG_00225 [Coccidioides immitis RMSCC 2394]KMU87161.1 hypothetical protein CIHG_05102 [Coccidioides immitis H538.4]